jgi:hypothetical protein
LEYPASLLHGSVELGPLVEKQKAKVSEYIPKTSVAGTPPTEEAEREAAEMGDEEEVATETVSGEAKDAAGYLKQYTLHGELPRMVAMEKAGATSGPAVAAYLKAQKNARSSAADEDV